MENTVCGMGVWNMAQYCNTLIAHEFHYMHVTMHSNVPQIMYHELLLIAYRFGRSDLGIIINCIIILYNSFTITLSCIVLIPLYLE